MAMESNPSGLFHQTVRNRRRGALERIQLTDSAEGAYAFESRAASAGSARSEVLGIVRRAKALRSSGCESRPATIVPAVMLSW